MTLVFMHCTPMQLTDQQLDGIVRDIQTQFPTSGNWQMQGHQLANGIRMQQQLIRVENNFSEKTG